MLVTLITIALGFIGIRGIQELKLSIEDIGNTRLSSLEALLIISGAQTAIDASEKALLIPNISTELRSSIYGRIEDAKKTYR